MIGGCNAADPLLASAFFKRKMNASQFGGLLECNGSRLPCKNQGTELLPCTQPFRNACLLCKQEGFIYVNVANSTGDSARMAAQVISGIGFLGAGTIMTTGNDRVKGLTTAAALWVTAAIGIAIGTGFYFGGIAGLIVLYLSSFTYRYIDAVIVARSRIMRIYVEGESEEFMLNLVGFFQKNEIRIISLVRKDENKWFLKDSAATIEMDLGRKRSHFEILDEIRRMKELRYIEEV